MPGHPFGSVSARLSLATAKRTGANTVAVIPFLWQSEPLSPHIWRGAGMSNQELRRAIRDAHALGFRVIVKPQVWLSGSWAGAVDPRSKEAWATWFVDYHREIESLVRIATEEHAEVFAIGTELVLTSHRPEWIELIRAVRADFPGSLLYFAHDVEEAERVPFWSLLDAIGVTLYPTLGADNDRANHLSAMSAVVDQLDALSSRFGKPVLVGEIGLRSAVGAAPSPGKVPKNEALLQRPSCKRKSCPIG